jgi:isoamyl acetate esterase
MTDESGKILLLGDSLTQLAFEGWGSVLANVYQRRADIVNRGCSGYTTEFYNHVALPQSYHDKVCLVTIFFGANDASLESENPHHYVSLPTYSRNLQALIARVQQTYGRGSETRILLITPTPLDHEQRLVYQRKRYGDQATGVLERTTENTQLYAQACRAVAAEANLPCLDLFEAMRAVPDYGRFLCDGLHFSAAGHDFVAQQILQAIAEHYPELAVTPCPVTGQWNNSASTCPALDNKKSRWAPYHDLIDHTDIDAAFREE